MHPAFSSTHWLEIAVLDFQAEYGRAVAAPIIHVQLIGRAGSSTDRACSAGSKRMPGSPQRTIVWVPLWKRTSALPIKR